ncbi:unnamed protein product, partial [Trichobilharzia regenti]
SDDVNIPSGSHSEIKSNTKRNTNSCRDSESYPLPLRNLSATTGPFRLRIGWHCHLRRPPPQPLSDSMAFHVFQLAKKIREGACGPSGNGSMFVAEPEANDTVHRNLQLVSFQLGLYGLGLFNGLLPSWQNRTFSRNGGWISQQVFEIGIPAACILYHSWQQHLTASELAAISFQLSRENNRSVRISFILFNVHYATYLICAQLFDFNQPKHLNPYLFISVDVFKNEANMHCGY